MTDPVRISDANRARDVAELDFEPVESRTQRVRRRQSATQLVQSAP
jgi:hypothetical protein